MELEMADGREKVVGIVAGAENGKSLEIEIGGEKTDTRFLDHVT